MAGKSTIPSLILDRRDDEGMIRLIENTQREDLLPEEIAMGLKEQMAKGYSHDAMAAAIGKKKPAVSKYLKIAELVSQDGVQEMLIELRRAAGESRLGFEHLYEAACKSTLQEAIELLRQVVNSCATVRQIRSGLQNRSPVLGDQAAIQSLKRVRKHLAFPFFRDQFEVNDATTLLKEVDLTLNALDEAREKLHQAKKRYSEDQA